MPPCRGPWAACTDSRRERWTTGRARVACIRAFPTMGLARRRDAETRLTTQGTQRSSGGVIGLFGGARDRRARRLDGRGGRRGHGRHRARCARARVARRLDRRCERAAIGRGRIGRAGARLARGIGGAGTGGNAAPASRAGARAAIEGPRWRRGARTVRSRAGRRRERRGVRCGARARTIGARAVAPAGAGATRSGAGCASSAAPGKAPKPSRPPTTSAAAAVAASSDPVAASPAKAARLFSSRGIRAVLRARGLPRARRPHGPAGRMFRGS